MRFVKLTVILCVVLSSSYPLLATEKSLNIGYHNPPGADVGANFLFVSNHIAFELGIGWVDIDPTEKDNDDDSVGFAMLGDMNLKILLSKGKFRPYLQGGLVTGISGAVGKISGFDASTGNGFYGIGAMFGKDVYVYSSADVIEKHFFYQLGLGFSL